MKLPAPATLLRWYDQHRRALPWRAHRPDPYHVWLSEVMLQQTRIEVVRARFVAFLTRFGTVAALARASERDVLQAWAGLGYYSRARNLHRAARFVVERHGGRMPATVPELRALPGVGRYTAGAIASIAFGQRAAVVDGNVARVLARLGCIEGDPRDAPVAAALWRVAEGWVPGDRPGDFNQALMELGEVVCTPRAPDCGSCPLRRGCGARRQGRVGELPARRPARARPEVSAVAAALWRGPALLFVRRAPAGLLGGLWELPGADVPAAEMGPAACARVLRDRTGLAVEVGDRLGEVRHVFTHRALTLAVFASRASRRGRLALAPPYDDHAWLPPAAAPASLALSTLTTKVLAVVVGR